MGQKLPNRDSKDYSYRMSYYYIMVNFLTSPPRIKITSSSQKNPNASSTIDVLFSQNSPLFLEPSKVMVININANLEPVRTIPNTFLLVGGDIIHVHKWKSSTLHSISLTLHLTIKLAHTHITHSKHQWNPATYEKPLSKKKIKKNHHNNQISVSVPLDTFGNKKTNTN